MQIEKKMQPGLVGTLFLVATLVLLFFHTRPTRNEVNVLQTQEVTLEQEVNSLGGDTDEFVIPGKISEVERKTLNQAIPPTLEQEVLIADLNRLAQSAQVIFNGLSFTLESEATPPHVNVAGTFQGATSSIIYFLKLLEENPRKFVVKDASVSRTESEAGLDFVTLNLTMQAFYRGENVTAPVKVPETKVTREPATSPTPTQSGTVQK